MTSIYLKEILISNFRAYGEDFTLSLPGPGVTILSGPNGLGKSTFFEAIEWALTGTVRRIAELEISTQKGNDRLARREQDSPASRYGVKLEFSSPSGILEPIQRWTHQDGKAKEHFSELSATSALDIARILRAESWPHEIGDLGEYIRLTHLLSQSPNQRFTSRKSKDQWQQLRGAAGTAKVDLMAQRLGTGTIRAFTENVKQLEVRRDIEHQNLQKWRELISRRSQLSQQAAATGGLPGTSIEAALKQLNIELGRLNDESAVSPPNTIDLSSFLAHTLRRLESFFAWLDERRTILERAPALVASWQQLQDSILNQRTLVDAARGSFEQLQRRQNESGSINSRLVQAQAERELLERVNSARHRVRQQRDQVAALLQMSSQLAQELAGLREHLANALTLQRQASALDERIQSLTLTQRQLEYLREQYEIWQSAHIGLSTDEPRRQELLSQTSLLESQVSQADSAIDAQRHAVRAATEQLARERDQASATQRAVSFIAAHIDDDEHTCPVCKTFFPEKGGLRTATQMITSMGNARLTEVEKRVSFAQNELARLEAIRAEFVRELDGCRSSVQGFDAAYAQNRTIQSSLQASPFLSGVVWEDAEQHIGMQRQQLEQTLEVIRDERLKQPDAATLDQIISNAQSLVHGKTSELEGVHKSRAHAETELLAATRFLDQNSALLHSLGTTHTEEQAALASAAKLVEDYSVALRALLNSSAPMPNALARAQEEFSLAQDLVHNRIAALRRLEEQAMELQRQWISIGLGKTPSAILIEERRHELAHREAQAVRLRAQRQDLANAWLEWQRSEELRKTEVEITALLGSAGANEAAFERQLIAQLSQAETDFRRAVEARRIAGIVAQHTQAAHEVYSDNVLRPLDALAQKYLLAISAFPEMSLEVGARTRYAKGHFQLALKRMFPGSDKATEWPLPAECYLSEGQMSSLGVALLLSMSTAYRWSKWQALLLDDPLQHHDLIHTSAFIEVLRNVVREENYQVVLSTHDEELADYIRRKMLAASIPCTTCRYTGLGSSGVNCEVF